MNLLEPQRAFTQLRLGGIAAVLETRSPDLLAQPIAEVHVLRP
ncbi:MAG: hypothetical protein JWO80_215 [Bryobacterales bacterium]|nr:hypothetical protein [Bryobacterales bacterium]